MTKKESPAGVTAAEVTADALLALNMSDKHKFTKVTTTEVPTEVTTKETKAQPAHARKKLIHEAGSTEGREQKAKPLTAREKKQQRNRERNKRKREEAERRTGLDWADATTAESFVIDEVASATAVGICAKDFAALNEKTKRDLYYCICKELFTLLLSPACAQKKTWDFNPQVVSILELWKPR
jgi:hypothetical protein